MTFHRLLLLLPCVVLPACQSIVFTGAREAAMAAAEERTFGEVIDDAGIYTEINHYFIQTDVNDLLPNVNVTVRQGRVLLTGKVDKYETSVMAVRQAWKADGVIEVINEIEVVPEGGLFSRANDEVIEKQVEGRLTITKGVNILNYSVEVVNSKVYLLGLVMDEAELQRVLQVARTTQGVKSVISHLRLPSFKQTPPLDNI